VGEDIFSFIEERKRAGEGVVLATVVKSRGSAPVSPGTRMAVTAREISGTVGGGPLEAEVIAAARAALAGGEPRLLSFRLDGEEAGGLGMPCGGEQEIFLGGNTPEEIAVGILAEIIAVRQGAPAGHLRDQPVKKT
jgi:xanthine dehydrogenase accessory factor